MDYSKAIELGLNARLSHNEIIRKIYLTYPTKVFIGAEEQQYELLNEISTFFKIPINAVQIAGSAKTGASYHQKTEFKEGVSDLDVAIIDHDLFISYMELVFRVSKGYSDHSLFVLRNGKSTYEEYVGYLARGMFRPDLMPICPERAAWHDFFNKLSNKHINFFKSINAAIYLSQSFFENKQRSAIRHFIEWKLPK